MILFIRKFVLNITHMASILIAESGSTKTDWCLISKGKKNRLFKSDGINPHLQDVEGIKSILDQHKELSSLKNTVDALYFYGAGTGDPTRKKELEALLGKYFNTKTTVQTDIMAAALGLAGNQPGIVSILGTGSNSCYYDGKKIKTPGVSLGYIAGDEGSGNHMGKRVLQYYAYNTFDTELKMSFEMLFGNDIRQIVRGLYDAEYPNRYLANFVKLLVDNRGHFMVENIIEDCLNDFFYQHLIKYRQSINTPIHFTGSVSYLFKDVIINLCSQYELTCGKIEQSPLEGLIKYHKSLL